MNKIVVMALIAVGLVPTVLAADQSDSRRLLLEQLRTERQAAVVDRSRVQTSKPQIDLNPLLGVSRNELLQSLGAPDFGAPPEDAGCIKSTRLAYFFYPHKPSTGKDVGNGSVEVTVSAGGGWALEVKLTHDSVAKVSWVKQE